MANSSLCCGGTDLNLGFTVLASLMLRGSTTNLHLKISGFEKMFYFRSHPSANSGFQQQRPTHKPIIVFQQHQPQNKGAASHHAPTKVQSTFDQLIKHNVKMVF